MQPRYTLNQLYRTLSNESKLEFRKYERFSLKEIDASKAIIFNNNCIRERLCPKSIKKHGNAKHNWKAVETILLQRNSENKDLLEKHHASAQAAWRNFTAITNIETQETAKTVMKQIEEHHSRCVDARLSKKLFLLNGGNVRNEERKDGFLNLSDIALTKDQIEFLNLGLKCHYIKRPHAEAKRINTEILIEKLLRLEKEKKVALSHTIVQELIGESGRDRNKYHSRILSKKLKEAAKSLRENDGIIVRRGDKSSIFVIMNRPEYNNKLDTILGDESKFMKLESDPTDKLKKRISQLNASANQAQEELKFPKVEGDFRPGYCYGTVKTHKHNNPLRPIIAQMSSPTYRTAKFLNEIITPFIPVSYSLNSPSEFIDILSSTTPGYDIASLDVENLFTNVPVEETIQIILDRIYRSDQEPLKVPESILQEQLRACTMESPFYSHRGEIFRQVNGVSMGSPLGVLFAEAYMAEVERRVMEKIPKPRIYCRFRDDICTAVDEENELERLALELEKNSVLKFTIERTVNRVLPYLDVRVEQADDSYNTQVYVKPTNIGRCLNARGECPDSYKRSVVAAYVKRALTHSKSWEDVHRELERIRQLLTNNGFRDEMIEQVISKRVNDYVNRKAKSSSNVNNGNRRNNVSNNENNSKKNSLLKWW